MLWIFVRIARRGDSNSYSQHIFLGVNKGKKLFIIYHTGICWDSLHRQIRFNGRILGDKCCRYNEVPLYITVKGRIDTLSWFFSAIFTKGEYFLDFKFTFRHAKPLLGGGGGGGNKGKFLITRPLTAFDSNLERVHVWEKASLSPLCAVRWYGLPPIKLAGSEMNEIILRGRKTQMDK